MRRMETPRTRNAPRTRICSKTNKVSRGQSKKRPDRRSRPRRHTATEHKESVSIARRQHADTERACWSHFPFKYIFMGLTRQIGRGNEIIPFSGCSVSPMLPSGVVLSQWSSGRVRGPMRGPDDDLLLGVSDSSKPLSQQLCWEASCRSCTGLAVEKVTRRWGC